MNERGETGVGDVVSERLVRERLVRVETKLDVLLTQGEQLRLDHETRLRAVERLVTELKVRSALLATGTGTGAGIVTAVIARLAAG
jgi:hypothetical protein